MNRADTIERAARPFAEEGRVYVAVDNETDVLVKATAAEVTALVDAISLPPERLRERVRELEEDEPVAYAARWFERDKLCQFVSPDEASAIAFAARLPEGECTERAVVPLFLHPPRARPLLDKTEGQS